LTYHTEALLDLLNSVEHHRRIFQQRSIQAPNIVRSKATSNLDPAREEQMSGSPIDPTRTLPALRSIETAFSASVLHPAVLQSLRDLGVEVNDAAEVNIVTRSAAMRTDNPEVVWSAFYNPHPATILRLIPATWRRTTFEAVLAAQSSALDEPFRNATANMNPGELNELAQLCRTIVASANANAEGRPLFAGLASLPLPSEDHLMIWHAARLLREHRGDGHIAALVVEGLGRIDALVVHAAMLPAFGDGLRRSRRWSIDDWNESITGLRARGWLTEDETPTFTDEGRARRQWIEDRTDLLAAKPFEPVGAAGLERMIELGTSFTAALEASGLGSTLRINIPMGD
jgi:hypothetical protein